jgi:hypothetical protein
MPFSAAQAAPNGFLARCLTAFVISLQLHRLILRACATGIFAAFFSAVSVVPVGAEIAIEVRIGFHGLFQLGRPFPLEVELTNSGRPTEGTLDVQVWKGGATKGGTPYPVNIGAKFFLPHKRARACS